MYSIGHFLSIIFNFLQYDVKLLPNLSQGIMFYLNLRYISKYLPGMSYARFLPDVSYECKSLSYVSCDGVYLMQTMMVCIYLIWTMVLCFCLMWTSYDGKRLSDVSYDGKF